MESRNANMIIGKRVTGTLNYKISLPAPWVKALGVEPGDKGMIISFDGERIIIEKEKDTQV